MRKQPHPIDIHVGGRLRLRRMLVGISQEKLGAMLGLTFQQVQKYEKGFNRISASRLHKIAQILGVEVQFFFDDLPQPDQPAANGFSEPVSEAGHQTVMSFLSSAEGLQLNRCYTKISNARVRKSFLDLVHTISSDSKNHNADNSHIE